MNKLLITFGCSWTYGVAAGYNTAYFVDNQNDYKSKAEEIKATFWDSDLNVPYSYRSLLCKKYNLKNINFSESGSSNQTQFRLAEKFFESKEFFDIQKKYKDGIYVSWAITSTARAEFFINKLNKFETIFYNSSRTRKYPPIVKLSLLLATEFYNLEQEVEILNIRMKHWNTYFEGLGIKNIWIDTFNHHDYLYPPYNLVFKEDIPRDLLSKITNMVTYDKSFYHTSEWTTDGIPIKKGIDLEILNPYTMHPTPKGHEMIADILSPEIEKLIGS